MALKDLYRDFARTSDPKEKQELRAKIAPYRSLSSVSNPASSSPYPTNGNRVSNDGLGQNSANVINATERAKDQWNGLASEANLFRARENEFRKLSSVNPTRGPRTRFFDPMAMIYATGYRDRRHTVSYETLKRVCYRLGLVGSIILTRVNQVAAFAYPYRENKQVGFAIRFKDEHYIPDEKDQRYITELEKMVMACGFGENPFSPFPRDDFEAFLKKISRDSLMYDQETFEVIPDEKGRPYEFRAVDASTIRLAATYDGYRGDKVRNFQGREFSDKWRREYGDEFTFDGHGVYSVQVIHGRIENIFTSNDLAFCVRNPRSDIWANGYGYSEVEMALETILRMIWAEEYNARNFRQGSMANGIINLKGDQYAPEQLEAFRRMWQANVVGVENSWRIPIMQVPEGVEFVNLQKGSKEMEYRGWLDYLIKVISSCYQIDPAEINFDIGGGGNKTPLFESKNEWKIKHSKDKGLRPLLKHVAKSISKHVIDPLDDRLYLDFVGLDALNDQDRHAINQQKITTTHTINEIRAEDGKPPVIGGDIILNPTYFQAWQQEVAKQNLAAEAESMAPWQTSGTEEPLEYGTAPPIPLHLQASYDSEQGREQGDENPMGDMGGNFG